MWDCKDCTSYHNNNKDFDMRGYEDHDGYHQDIEDRATQDKECGWPGRAPLAYFRKEDRHGPPELDRRDEDLRRVR